MHSSSYRLLTVPSVLLSTIQYTEYQTQLALVAIVEVSTFKTMFKRQSGKRSKSYKVIREIIFLNLDSYCT